MRLYALLLLTLIFSVIFSFSSLRDEKQQPKLPFRFWLKVDNKTQNRYDRVLINITQEYSATLKKSIAWIDDVTVKHDKGSSKRSCMDWNTCFKLHVQTILATDLFSNRCDISPHRKGQFSLIHYPKCGGSSMTGIFKTNEKTRFVDNPHYPFILAASKYPDHAFVTLLRHPVSRALSMYGYINQERNDEKDIKNLILHNPMWQPSYHVHPVAWTQSELVRGYLYEEFLNFFSTDPSTFADLHHAYVHNEKFQTAHYRKISMAVADVNRTKSFPAEPLIKTHALNHLDYIDSTIPAQYQCRHHMKISLDMMTHFSVIGVLENLTTFVENLSQRLGMW